MRASLPCRGVYLSAGVACPAGQAAGERPQQHPPVHLMPSGIGTRSSHHYQQCLRRLINATPPCIPLSQSAQLFLDSYDSFRALFCALSTLDVLAGFAAATSPEAAPLGCAFCRPSFAAGAGGSSGSGSGGAGVAPPLRLQGLWHPALLASRVVDGVSGGIQARWSMCNRQGLHSIRSWRGVGCAGVSILMHSFCLQANDLSLGGPAAAGMLLLTGPNTGKCGACGATPACPALQL